MSEEWFFYVVRCKNGSLYSGISNNVEERLKEHNSGNGAKYTRAHLPVVLVYSESYSNQSQARKREEQVKRWAKVKKEKLIAGLFPKL